MLDHRLTLAAFLVKVNQLVDLINLSIQQWRQSGMKLVFLRLAF